MKVARKIAKRLKLMQNQANIQMFALEKRMAQLVKKNKKMIEDSQLVFKKPKETEDTQRVMRSLTKNSQTIKQYIAQQTNTPLWEI